MIASESLYSRLGGEVAVHAFVNHLYDFMESTPEVAHVRQMHASDLSHARQRLFMFLSGMLGGPPLYTEAFGHPRLRRKHLHFEIGDEERDQWLACAQYAADRLDVDGFLRAELIDVLAVMANHLRNKEVTDQSCNNLGSVS